MGVFDMSTVPDALKSPLTNAFLREAVQMPCCKKCANDGEVRPEMIASQKCPLCGAGGVSSEDLILRHDIRKSVNDWIAKKKEADENADNEAAENEDTDAEAATSADPWGGGV